MGGEVGSILESYFFHTVLHQADPHLAPYAQGQGYKGKI